MTEGIKFLSAYTVEDDFSNAIRDLAAQIESRRQDWPEGGRIDLVVVFLSPHFTGESRAIIQGLLRELAPRALVGCTAEGVICRDQEIEEQSAIALAGAHFPDSQMTPFVLQPSNWPNLLLDVDEFQRRVGVPSETNFILMFADPFSTPMDDVLVAFNRDYPKVPIAGGMASGALRRYGNALFVDDVVINEGAVGVAISGSFDVDLVVSQGCRPIWRPFRVDRARLNTIYNIEGRSPLEWIEQLTPQLPEEDRDLLKNGLFVGRAIQPDLEELGRGDFLIRGVIGVDHEDGSIVIGDSIMDGETIQFHLRDAVTAKEDLEMMLVPQAFRQPPSGGLLFSCNGRGTRLYDHPDGDISIIQNAFPGIPVAGFFCAGELGPIGGQNFLHGQTASLALFRSISSKSLPPA